ncbi:unnamed protein product [Ixodes pacificus]
MAPSTIATILRNRQKIMKLHRGSQLAPTRKRLRLGNYQNVDAAVLTWFKDARLQDVPVSGPMLQEKAQELRDWVRSECWMASLFSQEERNYLASDFGRSTSSRCGKCTHVEERSFSRSNRIILRG